MGLYRYGVITVICISIVLFKIANNERLIAYFIAKKEQDGVCTVGRDGDRWYGRLFCNYLWHACQCVTQVPTHTRRFWSDTFPFLQRT